MRFPELIAVHDRYLALSRMGNTAFAGHLSGKLLLRSGFDPDGIAVVLASSVAGATSLCMDAEADLLREGMRAGFCDFVVGQLDESLRILKNELRRGRSISVGLITDPERCVEEIVALGLQPDLVSAPALGSSGWTSLCARGAIVVLAAASMEAQLSLIEWRVAPAASMVEIARLAAAALDPERSDTPGRLRWLEHSPAYLGRVLGGHQCLRMTSQEIAAFLPAIQARFPSASVTAHGTDV